MPRLRHARPYVDDGIERTITADGTVTLQGPDGARVTARDRERIEALVIPPAWTDVWICAQASGHIQAVGTDTDGRRQYLYHPQWRERRTRDKYDRALELAAALPAARGRVTTALRADGITEERVLAAAFRLLDLTGARVGSRDYLRRHGSRGLTTLQRRHVAADPPRVTLAFRGKGGKLNELTVHDEDLAAVISELVAGTPRTLLLSWREGRRRLSVTPALLNTYVEAMTGAHFTAKDFRTLRGTIIAAQTLAEIGPATGRAARAAAERAAVQATADALGNTVVVARSSYIDPRVFSRFRRSALLDSSRTPESALRDLLLG